MASEGQHATLAPAAAAGTGAAIDSAAAAAAAGVLQQARLHGLPCWRLRVEVECMQVAQHAGRRRSGAAAIDQQMAAVQNAARVGALAGRLALVMPQRRRRRRRQRDNAAEMLRHADTLCGPVRMQVLLQPPFNMLS